MYWSEDEDIVVVWKDNNIVKVLSNHQGIEPIQKVSCYSRSEKKKVSLPQGNCISDYNKYMEGVDKMDWMVNKYKMKIISKKRYFPIFTFDRHGNSKCTCALRNREWKNSTT